MLQVCNRCVMDTTDPEITFDANGECHHCSTYDRNSAQRTLSGVPAEKHVRQLVKEIRNAGRNKEYDCIIGISGGVDSTYVAYKVKQLGLRPLAVHLDNGWNSELAVGNIERTLKTLDIDLYTHVIDWEEFKDLQIAFLKASTPDAEIPSDHAIVSVLFQMARRYGVKYILSGVNARTESHLPKAWSTGHLDWKYIRGVHRKFGKRRLTTYPHQSLLSLAVNHATIHWLDILNYLDYSKADAMDVLKRQLDWKYYGGKHYESIYTRFYQGHLLPRKFGFDKRKSHLSSLICGGEITREAALRELENVPYPIELQQQDREYVMKKLGFSSLDFDDIMSAPPKRFDDYQSYSKNMSFKILRYIYRQFRTHTSSRLQSQIGAQPLSDRAAA